MGHPSDFLRPLLRDVRGIIPAFIRRIPGLKSETWGTLGVSSMHVLVKRIGKFGRLVIFRGCTELY
jgi:hypothetical protein